MIEGKEILSRKGITSARVGRVLVVAATAALVGFGGSACGLFGSATVDKATVSETLKEELSGRDEAKKLTGDQQQKFADCSAEALLKYGNKEDLQKFVDGDLKADAIRGMDSKDAESATQVCALEATAK